MPLARLIFCERRGDWAVTLRPLLSDINIGLHETRSKDECLAALAESPASFVGVECVAPRIDEAARFITSVSNRFPVARVAALGRRDTELFELSLREAGAVHALFSPRAIGTLVQIVKRHFANQKPPTISLRESMLARLPWGG